MSLNEEYISVCRIEPPPGGILLRMLVCGKRSAEMQEFEATDLGEKYGCITSLWIL